MPRWVPVAIAALVGITAIATACGDLKDANPSGPLDASSPPSGNDGDGDVGSDRDGGPSSDGASSQDAIAPSDAGITDAQIDGPASGDSGKGPTGLDPAVVLPNLAEPTCSQPGNPSICGGTRACRMATPDSGRCDDCSAPGTCGTLITHPCSASLDCDIDLECFRGKCTIVCTLPTGPECGAPNNCIDVGSVQYGLCDPAKLF